MIVQFSDNFSSRPSSRQVAQQNMGQHVPVVYQGGRNKNSANSAMMQRPQQVMRRANDDMFAGMENMFRGMENMFAGFGFGGFPQSTRNVNYVQKPMTMMSRAYVMESKFDPQGRMYQQGYMGQQLRKRGGDGTDVVSKEEHFFDSRDPSKNYIQNRRQNNEYYDNDEDYFDRRPVMPQKPKRSNSQAIRKAQNPYSGRKMIGGGNVEEPDAEWLGVFQMNDHVSQRPSVSRNGDANTTLVSKQRESVASSRPSTAASNRPSITNSVRPSVVNSNSTRPGTATSTRPSVTHSQRSERNVGTPMNYGRVRRNDIQPTQPSGREIIVLPENENRNPNPHVHRERPIPLPQAAGEDNVLGEHNVNIAPVRKDSGMKHDGVFKNKVVHKNMPMAG